MTTADSAAANAAAAIAARIERAKKELPGMIETCLATIDTESKKGKTSVVITISNDELRSLVFSKLTSAEHKFNVTDLATHRKNPVKQLLVRWGWGGGAANHA